MEINDPVDEEIVVSNYELNTYESRGPERVHTSGSGQAILPHRIHNNSLAEEAV
jgi:hypothetical protein